MGSHRIVTTVRVEAELFEEAKKLDNFTLSGFLNEALRSYLGKKIEETNKEESDLMDFIKELDHAGRMWRVELFKKTSSMNLLSKWSQDYEKKTGNKIATHVFHRIIKSVIDDGITKQTAR